MSLPRWAAEVIEETVEGGGVAALGAPYDLLPGVVRDQGQVLLAAPPADVVDADDEQLVESSRVELLTDDAGDDPSDGVPVDATQPGDRGLVHHGGQVADQVLEVAAEPGVRAGERHPFGDHPVTRAGQPAQPGPDLQPPPTEIEMPPRRVHRPCVVTGRGGEPAVRAGQPTPAQRHVHHNRGRGERNIAHRGVAQGKHAVKCSGDAHGRPTLRLE